MASRIIRSEADREMAAEWLKSMALPFTLDVTKGKKRSVEQNRLQRMWTLEVAEQLGDRTAEEVRGFNKLTLGVPILRAENQVFAERYDEVVKPLPYETKLALMAEPLDFPVTRLMTVDQSTRYLDAVFKYWTEKGIRLTEPEARS